MFPQMPSRPPMPMPGGGGGMPPGMPSRMPPPGMGGGMPPGMPGMPPGMPPGMGGGMPGMGGGQPDEAKVREVVQMLESLLQQFYAKYPFLSQ